MSLAGLDLELIRKYDRPGPRYTSYPTAVQFHDSADKEALLAEAARGTGPLSLYFHIPFCEHFCWFCACHTFAANDRRKADSYLDALEKEMELLLLHLQPGRPVTQVHLGGGTPNFLSPKQIERLGNLIHGHFSLAPKAERAVELDPRTLTPAHIQAFRQAGFNRASLGVQDTNPEVQKAIRRKQNCRVNENALRGLRQAGFHSINVDLIYGLPLQTPESFGQTLDEVISWGPDRLAVFNYAHVPWLKPAQEKVRQSGLPGPETKLQLLIRTIEKLTGAGYVFIGMDHFAKETDELVAAQRAGALQRNFQGYGARGGTDICAFGLSAISQTQTSYRQNHKAFDPYHEALANGRPPLQRGCLLNREDQIRRRVIMELMCHFKLDFTALSEELGVELRRHFAEELEQLRVMEEDGLLTLTDDQLRVSFTGRLLIRNIAMVFDACRQSGEGRHSRTV